MSYSFFEDISEDNSPSKSVAFNRKRCGVGIVLVTIIAICAYTMLSNNAQTFQIQEKDGVVANTESNISDKQKIYIHVVGAVNNPGVYSLDLNSRASDAIEAAGGINDEGDSTMINLARILSDGEQLNVPYRLADSINTQETNYNQSMQTNNGLVNINTADSEQLQTLDGIGKATAEKIIADRTSNGYFLTKEDIKRVSGIGEKKYEAIANKICV